MTETTYNFRQERWLDFAPKEVIKVNALEEELLLHFLSVSFRCAEAQRHVATHESTHYQRCLHSQAWRIPHFPIGYALEYLILRVPGEWALQ